MVIKMSEVPLRQLVCDQCFAALWICPQCDRGLQTPVPVDRVLVGLATDGVRHSTGIGSEGKRQQRDRRWKDRREKYRQDRMTYGHLC